MALRRRNIIIVFYLLASLPACSDFRAIFNGKPGGQVAKQGKESDEKEHHQKPPQGSQGYFTWPLQAPVSSLYGTRRGRFHDGIDIDGESGDPIVAAAAGRVVYSGKLGGYGRLIVIKHDNGYFTAYAHNENNAVKKGDEVSQGQLIGRVGATGSATGDHLHFEVRDKKGTYDPLDFLPQERYSRNR
jgi:lipoprotein NlpD